MRYTNTTVVDFYQGAYGPTIRVDVQDISWLKLFKESILKLMSKVIAEVDLLKVEGVEKSNISGLKLILGLDLSLTQTAPQTSGGCPSFLWTASTENLEDIVSAISRLIRKNTPGHYYFYEDGRYLIEFAFKE